MNSASEVSVATESYGTSMAHGTLKGRRKKTLPIPLEWFHDQRLSSSDRRVASSRSSTSTTSTTAHSRSNRGKGSAHNYQYLDTADWPAPSTSQIRPSIPNTNPTSNPTPNQNQNPNPNPVTTLSFETSFSQQQDLTKLNTIPNSQSVLPPSDEKDINESKVGGNKYHDDRINRETNLHRLFSLLTPQIPIFSSTSLNHPMCSTNGKCLFYYLSDLWNFYNNPFGINIPIIWFEKQHGVHYIPYLSAIQLRDTTSNSVVFQYYEKSPPSVRLPLIDIIISLAKSYPLLLTGTNIQFSPTSWFAINWVPIQPIRNSSGTFLVYHTLDSRSILSTNEDICNYSNELLIDNNSNNNSNNNINNQNYNYYYNVDNEEYNNDAYKCLNASELRVLGLWQNKGIGLHRLGIAGYVPYKIFMDLWYRPTLFHRDQVDVSSGYFTASFLIREASLLVHQIPSGSELHPDYSYCIQFGNMPSGIEKSI